MAQISDGEKAAVQEEIRRLKSMLPSLEQTNPREAERVRQEIAGKEAYLRGWG